MPRYIAVDWDKTEVRCVAAEARRGNVRILCVAAAPLPPSERPSSPHDIGQALRTALAGCSTRRARLLVAVDRASLDLVHLTLPPSRDEELPELVRLQLQREPHSADDLGAVDFVAESDDASAPRRVLAVTLSTARAAEIRAAAEAAGMTVDRLLLRPYSAASLLARAVTPTNDNLLLVAPAGDEVDLAVLAAGRVVYWRSVRLPRQSDAATAANHLATEVARTLAADAQARPDAAPIAAIYALGAEGEHDALAQLVHRELRLELRTINPLAAAGCEELAVDRPGRFAAILGAVLDEAHGAKHVVDLAHPRRAPKRHDRKRILALAGALALLGIGWLVSAAWNATAELDARVERLLARRAQLDRQLKQAAAERESAQALAAWSDSQVVWLDELRELSLRLPSQRDALLSRLTMNATAGGGQMELAGVVRDAALVARIESALRDATHEVHSNRVQERSDGRASTWQFESSVFVAPRAAAPLAGRRGSGQP